jgi:hypothetical protein
MLEVASESVFAWWRCGCCIVVVAVRVSFSWRRETRPPGPVKCVESSCLGGAQLSLGIRVVWARSDEGGWWVNLNREWHRVVSTRIQAGDVGTAKTE